MSCSSNRRSKTAFRFHFNPYEIQVAGKDAALRGRVAALVAALLGRDRNVACVLDRGTSIDPNADVPGVNLVVGDGQHGLLYPAASDEYIPARPLLDADVAVVESGDDGPIPKIVCAGDGAPADYQNVIAYVGDAKACPVLPSSSVYFTLEQQLALGEFLDEFVEQRIDEVPLKGLVLTGGRSTRMKSDKGALEYRGVPQVVYAYELLSTYCSDVFVSLRSEQRGEDAYRDLPQLHDQFLDMGPLGGILTALRSDPMSAWLVLACDLPFVTADTIQRLLVARNPLKLATAYISATDGFPEPLCAVYEPKSIFRLLQFLALGYQCPRKVLINSDTQRVELADPSELDNINTQEEREEAVRVLSGKNVDA